MKNIKVLGTGCANCKATLKLIDQHSFYLQTDSSDITRLNYQMRDL